MDPLILLSLPVQHGMQANIYQTTIIAAKSCPSSKTCVQAASLHAAKTVSACPDTDLNLPANTVATLLDSMF